MITCQDWRDASPDEVGPLFDAECTRWYRSLGWDYRSCCRVLEAGRSERRLPGLLARDAHNRVAGWTYFVLHEQTLHIGNLVAENPAVVPALLHAITDGEQARQARRLSCFLYPRSPEVETALAESRFAIERHGYWQRRLDRVAATTDGAVRPDDREFLLRGWSAQATSDLVGLFARAYEGMPQARCFAPDGRPGQWAAYVAQIVHSPACGRFDPALSLLAETRAGDLAGAVLVTALSDRTAHIAQMAVATEYRGRGLGERLVLSVCQQACNARYDRITLLVAESNDRASRLYARLGFEPAAAFLFADR
jgi:ribosomal protein S18 acetylase RimI-like enzyme